MFGRKKDEDESKKDEVADKTPDQAHEEDRSDSYQERDVESRMSASDDELPDVENKGIRVILKERNFVKVDFSGKKIEPEENEEPTPSSGSIRIQNTGNSDRISGINLELENISDIESEEPLEEEISIGSLLPGSDNDYVFDYNFNREIEPIKVEQEYYDPETGLSPSFLGGASRSFEVKITITNTSDIPIYNIRGEKTLNEFANLTGSEITNGEISGGGNEVSFECEELETGASTELILRLTGSLPDDVPVYEAGELKVTYEGRDLLTSGLGFKGIDGTTMNVRLGPKRVQRETEPTFYDCLMRIENRSEFAFDMKKVTVFAGDIESQQMLLDWNGDGASEDERIIASGDEMKFDYVFESPDGLPTFGNVIEFSVYAEKLITSETEITVPSRPLRFMAIAISKTFLDENDEELSDYEIPSYVETRIPALVTLTGVGSYPLEGLTIADEVPEGFTVENTEEVIVQRNGVQVSSDLFDVSIGAYSPPENATSSRSEETDSEENTEGRSYSDHSGDFLVVNFHHLEETEDGGFDEDETITVRYIAVASNLSPRDESIHVQAHGEGFVYEDESAKVYAQSDLEDLNMIVVHRRDDLDISKFISARDHEGRDAYAIELEAENFGSSTVSMEIKDMIPTGFELVSGSIVTEPNEDVVYSDLTSVDGGSVHGWTFDQVMPDTSVKVNFVLVETDDDANPRLLQSVYKG